MTDKEPLVKVDITSPVSLKAEIKTEIPGESSGRLLDALTDIIRPFTERRGLKADQIRLQREDVLIEIARRVQERARIEKSELKAVPNKFLVPFLEKASLEEGDSELIETWANLLHSAATNYDALMVRFSSILAEIGAREVGLLERLISGCRSWHGTTQMDDISLLFTPTHMMQSIRDYAKASLDRKEAVVKFIVDHEYPGALVQVISIAEGGSNLLISSNAISRDDEAIVAVLISLGVLNRDVIRFEEDVWDVWIEATWLTAFGIAFITACSQNVKASIAAIEARWNDEEQLSLKDEWEASDGLSRISKDIVEKVWGEEDHK